MRSVILIAALFLAAPAFAQDGWTALPGDPPAAWRVTGDSPANPAWKRVQLRSDLDPPVPSDGGLTIASALVTYDIDCATHRSLRLASAVYAGKAATGQSRDVDYPAQDWEQSQPNSTRQLVVDGVCGG